jgi:N-acetyl-anhydromuramyl-L-alanine amidase AmpD
MTAGAPPLGPRLRALGVELRPAALGNFGSRANHHVDTIVFHTTEGSSIAGALSRFQTPGAKASAHYVLDGRRIVQCVAEGDCAYHAGNLAVNRRSIGIEVVGFCAKASTWTPEILAQLVELCAELCLRHGVPLMCTDVGPGFATHADVPDPLEPGKRGGATNHTDPGPHFPWIPFIDALRVDLTPAGG